MSEWKHATTSSHPHFYVPDKASKWGQIVSESWAISPTYAVPTLNACSLVGSECAPSFMQMQMDFSVHPQLLDFCCCTTQALRPSPLFERLVSGVNQCPHIIAGSFLEWAWHPTSQFKYYTECQYHRIYSQYKIYFV